MPLFNRIRSAFSKFEVKFKTVARNGFEFKLDTSKDGKALIFSTPIYKSEGSIPRIIKEQALMDIYFDQGTVNTHIHFDDENNQILMSYSEELSQLNYPRFHELLDELIWVAEQRMGIFDVNEPFDYEFVCIVRN